MSLERTSKATSICEKDAVCVYIYIYVYMSAALDIKAQSWHQLAISIK